MVVVREEDGCNVCVFTLSCFLAKCVRPSLIVVRYLRKVIKK